uniref:Uncharacterized protein n=1 Tax=Triticum urartu TaxID=4572 RepID=A0A8R7THH4_TRIUA
QKLPEDLLLRVGDHHTTATICRDDLWLRRQPFQTPLRASSQPPRQRASGGLLAARSGLPLPSGFVPGKKEDDRRWSPCCCGGEGLDCFSVLLFRVLCVNFQDYCVTSSSFGILFVYCTPPTM